MRKPASPQPIRATSDTGQYPGTQQAYPQAPTLQGYPQALSMNAFADVSFFPRNAKPLTSYRKFWAQRFGTAPFLPMSREEMTQLGWDSCDIILVTGDAYVDHPSFGMAVIGRMLENQGFRVGIIAQPDWQSAEPFKALGKPNLFWGVTSGNMDSMINRYTADRKIRSDDAYTPGNVGGTVTLAPALQARRAPDDVLMVIARPQGKRMPVAVLRLPAAQLPLKFGHCRRGARAVCRCRRGREAGGAEASDPRSTARTSRTAAAARARCGRGSCTTGRGCGGTRGWYGAGPSARRDHDNESFGAASTASVFSA